MHEYKESYRDFKFWSLLGLEPTTSWILVWRSTNWAIMRSDGLSLRIVRYTLFVIKSNHLYLGTCCVFFFGGGEMEGGGTPYARAQGELQRFLIWKCWPPSGTHDLMNDLWRSTNWAIRRYMHGHKESYKDLCVCMCNELGVCQGPISHNNEQTQSVEGIIWFN